MSMPTEEQTYRAFVTDKLEAIDKKVTYTNGKVRKIIIAIVFLTGLTVGLGLINVSDVVPLLFP